MSTSAATKAGFVTLVGRPNAGKSTLLNRLVGERLAIVSAKPQSTRERVVGILSDATSQLIFLDTPGLLEPRYALHKAMLHSAHQAIADADVILYLVDATRDKPEDLVVLGSLPAAPSAPVIVVYNKLDEVSPARRAELEASGALVVSTSSPPSIERLLAHLGTLVPERPFLHDPDDIGTQPVRFFVGEYLREAAFDLLEEELPYSFTAEVDEFREDRSPVYIRATLYVERDSQKGIVIGKGGATLKQIGAHARRRLETLLGEPVYLETWVKVLPKWRKSRSALTRFGFPVPDDETR